MSKVTGLQGLRAVAALCIVAYHCGALPSDALCNFSVSLFFLLSGFLSYDRPAEKWLPFMRRKIARLWPLNALCLAYVAFLFRGEFGARLPHYLCDLFLVQSWIPLRQYYYSGDPVAWFLSSLLFCYALFPILRKVLQRHPKTFAAVLTALAVGWPLCCHCVGMDSEELQSYVYVAPYSRLLDFAFGMLARRIMPRLQGCSAKTVQALALLLCVATAAVAPLVPEAFTLSLWWFVPGALLVMSLIKEGFLSRFLSLRLLAWLGALGFGIYMWHIPLKWTVAIALAKYGIALSPLLLFLAVAPLSVAVAMLSSRLLRR